MSTPEMIYAEYLLNKKILVRKEQKQNNKRSLFVVKKQEMIYPAIIEMSKRLYGL